MDKKEEHFEQAEGRLFRNFMWKEVLDKIGYGFASAQFLNVLLYLSGASLFFVGIVNGIKSVLAIVIGVLAREYNRASGISKRLIGFSGIFFGMSLIMVASGKFVGSPYAFAFAMLLGSAFLVIYAEFSARLLPGDRGMQDKSSKYGLLITSASLFASAFFIDYFPENNYFNANFFGFPIKVILPGYLISLEIATIAFILSGYFVARANDKASMAPRKFSFSQAFAELRQAKSIFSNRFLIALLAFSIIIGIVQAAGNSYYGIFIYERFKDSYFGGFLNIAVVFLVAVFSSAIGLLIAKLNTKSYGPMLMLAAGALFLAAMQFTYYIGGNIGFLTAGTIIGIIGTSALGVSMNMLLLESLHEEERRHYYNLGSIYSVIPYAIALPFFSYFAQKNLSLLFMALGIIVLASLIFLLVSYKLDKIRPQPEPM